MPETKQPRDLLRAHLLRPRKSLGQNFLRHPHIAEEIVRRANISAEDTIIEVGVGLGALTGPLAQTARRVIGLEVDRGLIALHETERDLPKNVELRHQNILQADLSALAAEVGKPLHVVSNLPYSISHPFLFLMLDNRRFIEKITVMVQEEVAARLTAAPPSKEYGVATALFTLCATIASLVEVPPEMFYPQPTVRSRVIQITFTPTREPAAEEFALTRKIIKHSFGNRRKTLRNTLGATGFWRQFPELNAADGKALVAELLSGAAIADKARPEELAPEAFCRLARVLTTMRRQAASRST
ncbi:MAG: 16S rRNA (adenine(1518)-N(6)/adenine(1519)-N(6))-dimethyltransferase RsmA [Desulfobulbaceae bacterium]|jgi:16S rRNA (adenine1518-N6/adenine1519-N6)-dimethyltransferase|nr:16S rRNA (adenine(1518)-N(6)/adenine(1519)-N(6))-dimethyltransferase RsmA [Desulfobulbaceae bacterium]